MSEERWHSLVMRLYDITMWEYGIVFLLLRDLYYLGCCVLLACFIKVTSYLSQECQYIDFIFSHSMQLRFW